MTALPDPLDLSSASCTSRAYVHGAHLVDWTPTGGPPVLWLSPLATFDSAAAIRGGVPIVFPWFGPGVSGSMTPSHGFGRVSDWTVVSVVKQAESATATFELDSVHAGSGEFPHEYRAQYVVHAGEHLALEFTVVNTGSTAFVLEAALHAYLAVADVAQVTIEGLEGAEYLDKAAGPSSPHPVQQGTLRPVGETDRIYRSTGDVRIVDPVLGRVLVIRKAGSRSTIVWNPGAQKAAAPSAADIGAAHWREFVCVEGGNISDDAVALAPGESSTMTYAVQVEALTP